MPLRMLSVPELAPSRELWSGETKALIERGAVLPIISNYLLPGLFGQQDLPARWAAEIASPLGQNGNRSLARVGQFYGIKAESPRRARLDYHQFIKMFLLALAEQDPLAYADEV